jgi:hypothetical protein
MENWQKQITSQNEALIALIGRLVFPENELKNIIMRKKRRPEDYVRAYNLCDGKHSLTEIAASIKVSIGTLSPILAYWKSIGILYEIEENRKKNYKNLYPLEELKEIEIEDAKILESETVEKSNL